MANRFSNLKVAVLVTDGFEQTQLLEPKQALEAAGATVHVLSDKPSGVQGVMHLDKGQVVAVDNTIDQASSDDYSAVLLPGGAANGDALRLRPQARSFVHAANIAEKPIAAICHGGWLLISADLAKGRTVTSWPSLQDDFRHAGSKWVDQAVVRDRNLVSSRHPADFPAFNDEFMKLLDEQQQRELRQPFTPAGAVGEVRANADAIPPVKKLSSHGTAPAAPPQHEDEAFAIALGQSHQSDG
ncbi:MAG: type 1 glutamine amidotransferase [Herbaspirillum sp.]|nr:type 1 glutamine amidotransferase [Herbaspirillum sp.]